MKITIDEKSINKIDKMLQERLNQARSILLESIREIGKLHFGLLGFRKKITKK